MPGREDVSVRRDDEIAVRRHGGLREIKPHAPAQRPSLQVDRFVAGVVQFHKLLADILECGVIIDFVDHHAA